MLEELKKSGSEALTDSGLLEKLEKLKQLGMEKISETSIPEEL